MIRRIGNPPDPNRRYQLRPGAYAILPRDGQLLITVQYDPDPDVQLPGGGIDPGENTLSALYREVLEETGWIIAKPRRLGAFRDFTYMPEYNLWAEKLCHIYLALPCRQIAEPTETHHETLILTPSQALREVRNPGSRLFLKQLFG